MIGVAAVERPHIPFVTSGAYPTRPGNLVRPLIDGVPTFRLDEGLLQKAMIVVVLALAVGMVWMLMTTDSTPSWMH